MTLNEFKGFIDKLVEDGHGEKIVVYSCDDEGNRYDDVLYSPAVVKVAELCYYRGKGKDKVICID